jgi:uncharacterized membrane protein
MLSFALALTMAVAPIPAADADSSALRVAVSGPALRYVGRRATIEVRVTNVENRVLENVVVRLPIPAGADFADADSNGTESDGVVVWKLGGLKAEETKTVTVNLLAKKINPGEKITVKATADDRITARGKHAIEFIALPVVRLDVVDSEDPIEVGEKTSYKIDITNQGSANLSALELVCKVPGELEIVSTEGPAKATVKGRTITFPVVDLLKPNQSVSYKVDVKALKEADVRFRVELSVKELGKTPVIEEESTRIYEKKKE